MVIDYDHDRTTGMTDMDMIDAISRAYGPQLIAAARKSRVAVPQVEDESGTPLARWGDADYLVVLYRSTSPAGIPDHRDVAATRGARPNERTRKRSRLDEREAPQREIARQKKDVEDTRASEDKARAANKADFRP